MKTEFGQLMSKSRNIKKVTLRKLSQLVGLSPSFLSEVETGRRLPPKDEEKLRDIALVLGQDPELLIQTARKERVKKDSKIFDKIFNIDKDLAWGLYRAAEDESDETFKNTMIEALETLKKDRN